MRSRSRGMSLSPRWCSGADEDRDVVLIRVGQGMRKPWVGADGGPFGQMALFSDSVGIPDWTTSRRSRETASMTHCIPAAEGAA